jgi:DNA (cytosine-5)-methyltransferase 1
MKCVGLFAGIGGMELGVRSSDFETTLLCEILPEAQAVLQDHFAGVDLRTDVKQLRSIPQDTSLLCAGFPCQDLSSSGHKRGIAGLRSSLVADVFRLLAKQKCEWVLLENVKFMLHLAQGEAIKHITQAFEDLGYRWAYRVMNSLNYGVPQRRERVYILASRSMHPAHVLFRDPHINSPLLSRPPDTLRPIGFYWTEGTYATGLADDAVPPLKGGSTIGIPSAPAILFPSGLVGTPDLRDAERLQGFSEEWTRAAEEVVKPSFRWKLIGNAVTVNVCKWIAAGLRTPPATGPSTYHRHGKDAWPPAAFGEKGKAWCVEGTYGPFSQSSLSSFLKYPAKPLSYKAVMGFIGRAAKGNLKYPAGFIEALKTYARTL